jgi:GT2 family glycosyltransferase
MKVTAVIVTYNRLALLQECVNAIRAQTITPSAILIVNNDSTDGTSEWLENQKDLLVIHQPNRGGAWGFYTGIKAAYKTNADWFWIMDDDTIPETRALEELLNAASQESKEEEFGFLSSKVLWTDGSLHLMNEPGIDNNFAGKHALKYYSDKGIRPVIYNSFVSILVKRKAVQKAGLPIKEFFIWNDDVEYTQRIIKNGFIGAVVDNSEVLHKTPVNYSSNIFEDSQQNLWKYRFGLRNELYIRRHYKSYGSFIRNILKGIFIVPFKILGKRKTDRWAFIKMGWQSTWEALHFNPSVEYVND